MGIRSRIFFIVFSLLTVSISIAYVVAERDLSTAFKLQIVNELEKQANLLVSSVGSISKFKSVEVIKSVGLINLIKQVKESVNQVEEISGTHAGDKNFLVSATYDKESHETQIVMMDTTRSNRLENVRRDFITNLSHELRTPLSLIVSPLEQIIRGNVNLKDLPKLNLIMYKKQYYFLQKLICFQHLEYKDRFKY